MKLQIVCAGKIKEKWLNDGISEYIKRLSRYTAVEIVEVPDARAAIKIARIVWDLEPGISTCPEILDFLTDISIRTTFLSNNRIIL